MKVLFLLCLAALGLNAHATLNHACSFGVVLDRTDKASGKTATVIGDSEFIDVVLKTTDQTTAFEMRDQDRQLIGSGYAYFVKVSSETFMVYGVFHTQGVERSVAVALSTDASNASAYGDTLYVEKDTEVIGVSNSVYCYKKDATSPEQ